MRLDRLLEGVEVRRIVGDSGRRVSSLCYSSADVSAGAVFFARRGFKRDGHEFVSDAIARGASAIVLDREDVLAGAASLVSEAGPTLVLVDDSHRAMGMAASNFHGRPSEKMSLIGIVGTNGKTSISYLLEAILSRSHSVGVIGTICYRYRDVESKASLTTPDPIALQGLLCRMLEQDVDLAVLETSSHGLVQGRVEGCRFRAGIFSNITQEHLDYHETFDNYLAAKLIFFERYLKTSDEFEVFAVINLDDPHSARFIAASSVRTLTFSMKSASADFFARRVRLSREGTRFEVSTPSSSYEVETSLIGAHSVENCLAAIAASTALGASDEQIRAGIASLRGVPGRFEKVDCGQPFLVVVDFAHSPDAMAKTIDTARELTAGRIISVFGAGGDRDQTKREPMGRIAAEKSDICIITSDNPRTENPQVIIGQIRQGASSVESADVRVEPDRYAAIQTAIREANAGDTVLIMGKGHENCQIVGTRRLPFDDREVARDTLLRMGNTKKQQRAE